MLPPCRLPLELLDLIIDQLASLEEGVASGKLLGPLLFVSRNFRHRARRHLFRTIDPVSGRLMDRYRVTKRASLLRQLTLDVLDPADSIAPLIRRLNVSLSYDRLTLDSYDFVEVMKRLEQGDCSLCVLSLQGASTLEGTPEWQDLSAEFQEAFANLSTLSTLSQIIIHNIDGLPIDFFRGSRIRSLELHELSRPYRDQLQDITKTDFSPPLDISTLRNLSMDLSSTCYLQGQADYISAARLKQLSIVIDDDEGLYQAFEMFENCNFVSSLEKLTFVLPNTRSWAWEGFVPEQCPNFPSLKQLSIKCVANEVSAWDSALDEDEANLATALTAVARILEAMSNAIPRLQSIKVTYRWPADTIAGDMFQPLDEWAHLDQVLCRESLSHVQKIGVKLQFAHLVSSVSEHKALADKAWDYIKLSLPITVEYQRRSQRQLSLCVAG